PVIFYYQYTLSCQMGLRSDQGSLSLLGCTRPDCEVKCRTPSDLALHPYASFHHLHQLLADGQAQSRSSILPGHCGIHLGEGLEEQVHLILANAYSRILNRKMDLK